MEEQVEKLAEIKAQYAYWNNTYDHENECSECSSSSGDGCHGDGECGGDGE